MSRRARARGPALLAASLVLMVTACGEAGSSVSLPTPTGSRTGSLLPSRTTAPPSSTPTSSAPTSSAPSSDAASPTAPTSTVPSTPQNGEAEPADDSGTPSWVWWLLVAAAVVAAGCAALLVPRARRRQAWRADLAAAEGEVTWLARALLPQLQQARSLDEVAGGWQVAQGRVIVAEDQLTRLEPSAPDEPGRIRAHDLRDAVRTARQRVESLVATRAEASFSRDLGAITNRLTAVLDPVRPGS